MKSDCKFNNCIQENIRPVLFSPLSNLKFGKYYAPKYLLSTKSCLGGELKTVPNHLQVLKGENNTGQKNP